MPASASSDLQLQPAQHAPSARREARALAGAIDLLVVASLGILCAVAAFVAMRLQVDPFERDPSGGEWAVGYSVWLCWIPLATVYAALGSRTLGARLTGLRVVGATPLRLAARGMVWWLSALLLGAGVWWPWLDPRGRSLADIVSGTRTLESAWVDQMDRS